MRRLRAPDRGTAVPPLASSLRLMENEEENGERQRGEDTNDRGEHGRRGDDTAQKTRHAHKTTNRQKDGQQNHPGQRQERRIFESHGGSMDAPATICKRWTTCCWNGCFTYEAALAAFCAGSFAAPFATGLVFFAAALRTAAHRLRVASTIALRPAALSLRFALTG